VFEKKNLRGKYIEINKEGKIKSKDILVLKHQAMKTCKVGGKALFIPNTGTG
jgi:hypothetical protein